MVFKAFTPFALASSCAAFSLPNAKKTEVVVAHFNEDLQWVNKLSKRFPEVSFAVYSKGKPAELPISTATAVHLPNVGRESHTYLHHIVKHYQGLADWTVFTQGMAPSFGYHTGETFSGHLSDNVTFEDYLVPPATGARDASYFVISAACQLPSGIQSTRVGILLPNFQNATNDICPAGGADGWTSWWFEPNHPHHKAGQAMLSFYHKQVAGTANDGRPLTLGFAQGARFAVSRERIHRRPLEYYQKLLAAVSGEENPLVGFYLEAMWYDVFHPERKQVHQEICELPTVPRVSPTVADMWTALDARRRLGAGLAEAGNTYASLAGTGVVPRLAALVAMLMGLAWAM